MLNFHFSGIIYPIVIHWVWTPQGWLNKLGYTDFAGAGPVHILGGACSLVGTVLLGPRIGRFDGEEMPGHSTPVQAHHIIHLPVKLYNSNQLIITYFFFSLSQLADSSS